MLVLGMFGIFVKGLAGLKNLKINSSVFTKKELLPISASFLEP
jgi:hypothetical protein